MKHPAKYSKPIMAELGSLLQYVEGVALDPFAGTGRIHEFARPDLKTWGVEIEPEWATMHPSTIVGDALQLPFRDESITLVATSPTYGNRMADHHNAKDGSDRNTYTHKLGRKLHDNNSGAMQWGDQYRQFHLQAWAEVERVVRVGGGFFLNISNHIRKGTEQRVSEWHDMAILCHGNWIREGAIAIQTQRNRFGQNGNLRVDHEWLIVYRHTTKQEADLWWEERCRMSKPEYYTANHKNNRVALAHSIPMSRHVGL